MAEVRRTPLLRVEDLPDEPDFPTIINLALQQLGESGERQRQTALGVIVDRSQPTVSRWSRYREIPPYKEWPEIADRLQLPLEVLRGAIYRTTKVEGETPAQKLKAAEEEIRRLREGSRGGQ